MQSEQIDKLAEALAAAQGQIKNPQCNQKVTVVTRSGGQYEFGYADFAAVIDAVKKPLSDNGIGYIQYVEQIEDKFRLITQLMHSSGQWVSAINPLFLTPQKDRDGNALPPSSQDFGSAVTYMKRYALAAMTGVAADADDDANIADGNQATPQLKPAIKPPNATAAALVEIASGAITPVNVTGTGGGDAYANDTISVKPGSAEISAETDNDIAEMTAQGWRRFGELMVKLAREGESFTPDQQTRMSTMKKVRPAMWQKMSDAIADAQMTRPKKPKVEPKEPKVPPQPNPADDPDAYRLWFIDQLSQLETVDEVTLFTEEQSMRWKKCFPPDIEDWEAVSKERAKELGK